ncbi:response regulator [Methanosarcina sp. KYL-1]|uniref:response regulator n=1 Tax=Methanosarcina sp. KYL-1 TaxID=2602068 RepID=UPI002101D18D|nr:response regulator [Methanosarcina sp. KYL-1]
MKILIAEDEPISNLWLKTMLTKWGYEVISTRNGDDAWEVLKGANPPEIALLDWEMPKIKGIEVCEKAKKDPGTSGICIILLSGKDREEDLRKCFAAGADAYLKKPLDNERLKAKVDAARQTLEH